MSIFGRRQKNTTGHTAHTQMTHPPGFGRIAYEKYAAHHPMVVNLSEAEPRFAVRRADSARGGSLDGRFDGWMIEFWDIPKVATPFAALVIGPDKTIFSILVCVRGGPAGDHLQIFDPNGAMTRQGPFPPFVDLRAWAEPTFDMVLAVLGRRALRAEGVLIGDERTRAADAPAFLGYAASGVPAPLVESWVVEERIVGPDPLTQRVEIWNRIVDRRTDPPHPFHTPMVATAFGGDRIVGMVAVETAPEHRDEADLIVFANGTRQNMGRVDDVTKPAVFRETALQALIPLLRDRLPSTAILLEPDWEMTGLWDVSEIDGRRRFDSIDAEALPINDELVGRIFAWTERLEALRQRSSYPPEWTFETDTEKRRWIEDGAAIATELQRQLGPTCHVEYRIWGQPQAFPAPIP